MIKVINKTNNRVKQKVFEKINLKQIVSDKTLAFIAT